MPYPNFFAVRALEGLELVGQDCDLLWLIRRKMKGEELEDTVKQVVKALKSTSACSIRSSEWSEVDGDAHTSLTPENAITVPLTQLGYRENYLFTCAT
jgi:hypothetical protein